MKRGLVIVVAMLMFVLSASVVWADGDDQANRSRRAPEVPIALIYPAIGFASYGLYRLIRRA